VLQSGAFDFSRRARSGVEIAQAYVLVKYVYRRVNDPLSARLTWAYVTSVAYSVCFAVIGCDCGEVRLKWSRPYAPCYLHSSSMLEIMELKAGAEFASDGI